MSFEQQKEEEDPGFLRALLKARFEFNERA